MKRAPWIHPALLALLFATSGLRAPAEAEVARAVSWEIESRFAASAGTHFHGRWVRGEVEALDYGIRAVASTPIFGGPLLRVGIDWQRNQFALPAEAPLPNTLQGISVPVGLDFQIGEAWLFRLEMEPGFYGAHSQLRSSDFNIPVIFGGSYFVSSDLQFIAGVSIDANRDYPVLGGIGLRWKFAPGWVLNGVLPAPRLEYSISDSLTLYAGAAMRGATYRVDSHFGRSHGRKNLDNAIVAFSQIRTGIGASWKPNAHLAVEIEGGIILREEFDFPREDFSARSRENPAYGAISVKLEF
jgi:hypothetical protein